MSSCTELVIKEAVEEITQSMEDKQRARMHKWNHMLIKDPFLHEEFQEAADEVWVQVANKLYTELKGDL